MTKVNSCTTLVVLLIFLLASCQPESPASRENSEKKGTEKEVPPPVGPENKAPVKVAFVITQGVYNSELMAPWDLFHHTVFHTDSGMHVFSVAPSKDLITTFEGIRLYPDYDFSTCPEPDILVVPSTLHSMDTDLKNEELISFVREKGKRADFVMSLCDGAFVLAQAGLLDNRKCTTFPGDIADFRKMFPHLEVLEELSFVHHKNAITSAGGALSYDPALYLINEIYGPKVATGVGKGMVIDWDQWSANYMVVE